MERRAYDDIALFESTHWWFRGRREIIQSLFKRHIISRVQRALDVGCGTGANALLLCPYAREVVGWEANEESVALSRIKHPDLTVERVRFPEEMPQTDSFDIITLFDVLEHIEDDRAALRALESLLAPKGIAFLTVPAFPFLWSEHDVTLHHYRRYTRKTLLARIHESTSLRVLSVNYFNVLLFPLIAAIRLLKRNVHSSQSDFSIGSAHTLNDILSWIFGIERFIVHDLPVPFGASLLVVLKKE